MVKCKDCVVAVLGACTDLKYCEKERQILIAEARQLAERNGHNLSEFRKVKGLGIWEAECSRCGRKALMQPNPPPGEYQISGDAMTEPEETLDAAASGEDEKIAAE